MKVGDNVQWLPLGSTTPKTGKIRAIDGPIAQVRTSAWVRQQNRRVSRTVDVSIALLTVLEPR